MHMNIFYVTWEVSIGWDKQKVGHRKNKVCLKWELIVLCGGIWMLLCYQILSSFECIKFIIHCWFKFCFWCFNIGDDLVSRNHFLEDSIVDCCERILFFLIAHVVLMIFLYFLSGYEVRRSGSVFPLLHQCLHLVHEWFLWTLHLVWHCHH